MKQNSEKIFFTDLDGTLLNDEKKISTENWECIQDWIESGNKAVICTGRALSSALAQAKKLNLTQKGCYLIAYNGASIYDIYGETELYRKNIPVSYARHLISLAHKRNIHIQAYDTDAFICEAEDDATLMYAKATSMNYQVTPDLLKALTWETPKLLLIDYHKKQPLLDFANEIKEWAVNKVDYFFSSNALLEVVPPQINKGNAVKLLCSHLAIPLSQSLSAGDAQNDLSMLQVTEESIVMKNADPALFSYATHITEYDNNHSGVARALRSFF